LAILHLQKIETGNAAKTITTLLGFAQAIAEVDNWKKARCSGWTEVCTAERGMDPKAFRHHCRRKHAKGGRKTARSGAFS